MFRNLLSKASVLLLSFLAAISLNQVKLAGQDNIEIQLGTPTSYYKLSANEVKYFQVKVKPSEFTGKEDLIVKVQSSEHKGDPDLYISKKNTKPNSKSNSDQACETSGRDICTINHNQLSANQYVYMGVKCLEECRFNLRASLFAPIVIDDASEMQLDFQTDESKLFKFYVPAASASKDEENRVSSVTITASPILSQQDNIILTATAVKDETPNTKSSRGVPGWRKGQVLRLSESSGRDWCTDCWITILVDVTELGKYSVLAKSNVGVMQLQADSKVDDVAFFGDKTCYKYYVQSTDTDLVLKVQQYSGLISFTVNPKKPAESYDSAAFRYVGTQNSVLKVTPNDRKKASQAKGLYYICAIPHMTSTYSLVVSEPPKNQVFTYLEDGYDETGEIVGSDLVLYIYKVPPLEYKGEDIQLTFKLNVISGKAPFLGAAFCMDKKDHKKCAQGIKVSEVTGSNSAFTKGTQVGNDMYIIINHDERVCQDEYNGQCYYVIALVGQQKEEEITAYTVSVNHSQLNYYVLSENQLVTDFVNMGSAKYYSFTLMQDKKVKNVTFKLNTLHGDADLYVSRIHPYPTKIEYEKSSVKTTIDQDEVFFDKGNLSTTYYILVQSFQYSTYNLVVKVQREGQGSETDSLVPLISEGVPMKGRISGYDHSDNYRIYIKQLEGYEKAIRFQLQPVQGKFEFFINFGEKASNDRHFISTKDNFLEIKPNDKNFKREGYYFVNIRPRKNLWSILTDDNYEYILTYTTQDSYLYLSSKEPLETVQSANTYQYFRHFIIHKNEDISISMTVFNGNPIMYISITPENKFPTKDQYEYSSVSQSSIQGTNGKSVYISSKTIQSSSEACSLNIDNYVDVEPCATFVGVYCEEDCKYSLKLSYERGAPQKLTFGVPQHDVVKDGTFNYYYLIVREGKAKQIYAVLNSMSGNADLYVNFQENPQNSSPERWRLPSSSQYVVKSTETLKQDMINIQDTQLKDCFGRYSGGQDANERICAIVFGVYSPYSTSSSDDTDDEYNTRYNLVVYSDIIFIQSGTIMSGKVNEKEFQYYIFDALCHDCPIVISLSTFSSGDPDLYISFGDHSLPTKTTYDIYSSTYKSELIRITLDSDEVKKAGVKTLKGSLIIGVYGVKKSDFQISVTQEKNPIQHLIPGMSLQVSQQPYEQTYFMYYHDKDQTDLEFTISPTIGTLDVYISKFDVNDQTQNFVDKLPKSKRNAIWVQENIKPISTHDEKTVTILNEERNFCNNCYYLVAVISQDSRADYNIMAHALDASFENSLLLKIGETHSYSMKKNDNAIFKFITDEDEELEIEMRSIKGNVQVSFSYSEDPSKSFISNWNGNGIQKIKKSQIKIGEIMYLHIKCDKEDAKFDIQIKQERSILTLKDGIQQRVTMNNQLAKHFIFPLPEGNQALTIQVKTNSDNFYPVLMFKELSDVSSPSTVEFPPAGGRYNSFFMWDKNFGVLTGQKNLEVKGKKAGLAISLYDGSKTSGSAYVTASISSTVTLQAGQMYQGTLMTENSFMLYQANQYFGIAKGFIRIEFADCKGMSQVQIVSEANGHDSKIENVNLHEQHKLGRTYYYVPLPRKDLYIMVKPNLVSYDKSKQFEPHEYLLKVRYVQSMEDDSYGQRFQETKKLTLDSYSGIFQTANMTWKPIYEEKIDGQYIKADQSYVIVVTQDSNLNIESICQARTTNFTRKDDITRSYMVNQSHYELSNIRYDERYYVNVFGRVRSQNSEDVEVIPYEPYEIHMKSSGIFSLSNILIVIFGILVTVGAYQIYQRSLKKDKPFYREKGPSRQIEYELTNVASRRNASEYQVPTDLINNVSESDSLNTTSGF